MRHEPPTKGNPQNLTIKQHIIPSASLARFTNEDGLIELKKHGAKVLLVKPNNELFCTMRLWDQRAESGYMKGIEDKFQALADDILQNAKPIEAEDHRIITSFFSLIGLRYRASKNRKSDVELTGMLGGLKLTKEEEERLEKNHIAYTRSEGDKVFYPSRVLTGLTLQQQIDMERERLQNVKWVVLTAGKGEFVIPDTYGQLLAVPLSPKKLICSAEVSATLNRKNVAIINLSAWQQSKEYCFARSFKECRVN